MPELRRHSLSAVITVLTSVRNKVHTRGVSLNGGELTYTRYDDGHEDVTLRVHCGQGHCSGCDGGTCNTDHVILIDGYDAGRMRALLHELTE
jgi:hypothetical protein